ncbi:hypothetical protein [Nocardia inohanensis]|uniref:hypothetical protein n=1 Tax=Nocardia inohanensis TaxID=209246 RepID=UPI000831EF31|nr:hypothetical protein [Nocardia inohanensis]
MEYEALLSRAELVVRGAELLDEARRLGDAGDVAGEKAVRDQRAVIMRKYAKALPYVPVARCPDTGEVVEYKIDTGDLDGWFWDHDNPWREHRAMPATWLTMCGAMRLGEPVAFAKFWCEPGPGVPYVIPRILSNDGVHAVLNQISVGPHTGWAISYFGPRVTGSPLENVWGANTYDVYDDQGGWLGWSEHESRVDEYDFELAPWVESGKLQWIEAEDPHVRLRSGVDGCPYLGLPGSRQKAAIFRGEVRRSN